MYINKIKTVRMNNMQEQKAFIYFTISILLPNSRSKFFSSYLSFSFFFYYSELPFSGVYSNALFNWPTII